MLALKSEPMNGMPASQFIFQPMTRKTISSNIMGIAPSRWRFQPDSSGGRYGT
jgi:hypothetical protein